MRNVVFRGWSLVSPDRRVGIHTEVYILRGFKVFHLESHKQVFASAQCLLESGEVYHTTYFYTSTLTPY